MTGNSRRRILYPLPAYGRKYADMEPVKLAKTASAVKASFAGAGVQRAASPLCRGAGAAAYCWGQGATPIGGLRAASLIGSRVKRLAQGILTEQRFMKLTATMEQEQEENQRRLQELMRMLQQSDAQESEVRTFIREIRQYATIKELDETVLNRLISRILVGEVKKIDGQKTQEVRIVYNFIGELR